MAQRLATVSTVDPQTLSVRFVKGVGETRAALLEAHGFETVADLLTCLPFRYEDRRQRLKISDLTVETPPVTIRGRVSSTALRTTPRRRLRIFEVLITDRSGSVLLVWFNQPWLADQIRRDDHLLVFGQPKAGRNGRIQIENPSFEVVGEGDEADDDVAIIPVYSSVGEISSRMMRSIVGNALRHVGNVDDPLPPAVRSQLGLIDLRSAIIRLHHPPELDNEFQAARSPAHLRLILGELLAFQLALRLRRVADDERSARRKPAVIDDTIREMARRALPFRLTGAQKRVLREIATDLTAPTPMFRLVQGDVGCGKTIVALMAAIIVMGQGRQVALVAPTEILAEQHFERIRQLLEKSSIRVELLTARVRGAARRSLLDRLKTGEIDLLVGTHALLGDDISFRHLGLAIVDEQHRFGVEQRRALFRKGEQPDVLVMSATPIPRSLALSLFGALDVSIIDELPPGRQPIRTVVRGAGQFERICRFIDDEIENGGRAYVVFPIIEESETLAVTHLLEGYERLNAALPTRRLGLLHGRLSSEEKESVMRAFASGDVEILVSTTVVEVGLDVPEASVMVIMHADRFGLAQLHQLRGRVGRGARRSYCILVRDERASEEAKERLRRFEKTSDGFEVAEFDLATRGAGDMLGTRQAGLPRFRFADLVRDQELMMRARDAAIDLVRQDRERAERIAAAIVPSDWAVVRDPD